MERELLTYNQFCDILEIVGIDWLYWEDLYAEYVDWYYTSQ
jgi:hypothetical protein